MEAIAQHEYPRRSRLEDPVTKLMVLLVISVLINCGGGGESSTSAGDDGGSGSSGWLIPAGEVIDGGPGKDGIPALSNPVFVPLGQSGTKANGLVIGILADGEPRAIPHDIMDWHEVLNDNFQNGPVVMSYCPLTGSAMLWEASDSAQDPTFGVSGLLYNSNLILYDRETDSNWAQMRLQAVQGTRQGEVPISLPLVEMTIESWREMYPDSDILSRQTGFSRNYDRYPYGSFRKNNELLFNVTPFDDRMHPKTRVLGIVVNRIARAYVIDDFSPDIEVINDDLDGIPILVVGSADRKFGVGFRRTLEDGTLLAFLPSNEPLPAIVSDDEGNTWDLFGRALTGPRAGQNLILMESYVAYWFAWGAFHPGSEIDNL